MNKKLSIVGLLSLVMLMACGEIEVRVRNEFRSNLPNFSIGTVDFDTVKTGTTTQYQSIGSGTHTIFVNTKKTGEITIENTFLSPNTQWTLTVQDDDSGSYKLTED